MKLIKPTILMVLAAITMIACNTQSKDEPVNSPALSDDVQVYYFHNTKRCATCNAVESVTRQALNETYGNKISLKSFNLDEKEGKKKGNELEITGQALVILAGDKLINITNEGFLNARTNPDKLKQIIKEQIDMLL